MKEAKKRRIEKRHLRIALRYVLNEGLKHNTRVVEKKGNIVTLQIFEREFVIDPTGLITFFISPSPSKEIGSTYKIDISKLYFSEVIPHGFGPKPKSKRQRKRRREEARRELDLTLRFKRAGLL